MRMPLPAWSCEVRVESNERRTDVCRACARAGRIVWFLVVSGRRSLIIRWDAPAARDSWFPCVLRILGKRSSGNIRPVRERRARPALLSLTLPFLRAPPAPHIAVESHQPSAILDFTRQFGDHDERKASR